MRFLDETDHKFQSIDEFYKFEQWAFGSVGDLPNMEMMNAWNERHADLMVVRPEDPIYDMINEMARLWVKEGRP